MKITGTLFLATLFCVTWEKVHWNVAGAVGIADVLTILFLGAFALEWGRPRFPRTTVMVLAIFAGLLVIYLIGFFNIETKQSLDQWGKGMVKFVLHFLFLGAGVAYLARRSRDFYWQAVAASDGGLVVNGVYGVFQLLAARAGTNLDRLVLSPLTGGASQINVYGAIGGRRGLPAERADGRSEPPRRHAVHPVADAAAGVPPARARPPLARAARRRARRSCSSFSCRRFPAAACSGSGWGCSCSRSRTDISSSLAPCSCRLPGSPSSCSRSSGSGAITSRCSCARASRRAAGRSAHFGVYDFIPDDHPLAPALRPRAEQLLRLLRVRHGQDELGPALVLRRADRRDGLVGTVAFFLFLRYLFSRLRAARALGRRLAAAGTALAARVRPLAWGMTAALAGTMAANVFYLTMQFYYFYAFAVLVLALPIVFSREARRERE